MVSRVYVEKRDGFDVEARSLERELREILGVAGLSRLRLVNRYDVEGISEELFETPDTLPCYCLPSSQACFLGAGF